MGRTTRKIRREFGDSRWFCHASKIFRYASEHRVAWPTRWQFQGKSPLGESKSLVSSGAIDVCGNATHRIYSFCIARRSHWMHRIRRNSALYIRGYLGHSAKILIRRAKGNCKERQWFTAHEVSIFCLVRLISDVPKCNSSTTKVLDVIVSDPAFSIR